jgi:hypothetical protein
MIVFPHVPEKNKIRTKCDRRQAASMFDPISMDVFGYRVNI